MSGRQICAGQGDAVIQVQADRLHDKLDIARLLSGTKKSDEPLYVHLDTIGGKLRVTAGSVEAVYASRLTADGQIPKVAVEAGRILAVLGTCDTEKIELSVSANQLRLKRERGSFSFPFIESAKPDLLPWDESSQTTVESSLLSSALKTGLKCASKRDDLWELDGIALLFRESRLVVTGTNGRIMSSAEIECEGHTTESCMIPPKPAKILSKICAGTGRTQICMKNNGTVGFYAKGSMLDIRKYAGGELPDYEGSMLNLELPYLAKVNRERLVGGMLTMEAQTVQGEGCVFALSEGKLGLSAEGVAGKGRLELDIEYRGDPATLLLDPRLLKIGLGSTDEDELTLQLGAPHQPLRIGDKRNMFFNMPMSPRR